MSSPRPRPVREEDRLLAVVVGGLIVRHDQVEEAVDVLLEGDLGVVLEVRREQDRPFAPPSGISLLALLGAGELADLVEEEVVVLLVCLRIRRPHDPDPAPGDVAKRTWNPHSSLPRTKKIPKGRSGYRPLANSRELPAEGVQFHPESVLTPTASSCWRTSCGG